MKLFSFVVAAALFFLVANLAAAVVDSEETTATANNNNNECEVIDTSSSMTSSSECHSKLVSNTGAIRHYPQHLDNGMVRLCATISQLMYDATVTSKLAKNEQIGNSKYIMNRLLQQRVIGTPFETDTALEVLILSHGIVLPGLDSFWKTTTPFAIVVTDNAVLLAWRGTISLHEILSDISVQSFVPQSWKKKNAKHLEGVEAQKSFYQKAIKNLHDHQRTIEKLLVKDGRRKKLYLTGHSLGGGIAQLAHVELVSTLGNFLAAEKVEIHTITFSAPTSIAIVPPSRSNSTTSVGYQYLQQHVAPFMTNFVFGSDVVPHCYSHLSFVNDFSQEFYERLKDDTNNSLLLRAIDWFINFHKRILDTDLEKRHRFLKYRHIGKLVHYENETAKPTIYVDRGNTDLLTQLPDTTSVGSSSNNNGVVNWFETLDYITGTIADPVAVHMFLVSSSGLAFA